MEIISTKFWYRILTIVGITSGLIVLTAPAEAGDTFRLKGESVSAFFTSTDPSGCIVTDVYIFGSDNATISHNPPDPRNSSSDSAAGTFISQYDFCNFIPLIGANCSDLVPDPDFQIIGRKLDVATLNTMLTCEDTLGGPSFDVAVALTWTAIGDPVRTRNHSHFRTPGFSTNSQYTDTSRSAEAWGSVSDGITNFTPNPASSAFIQNVIIGEVVID